MLWRAPSPYVEGSIWNSACPIQAAIPLADRSLLSPKKDVFVVHPRIPVKYHRSALEAFWSMQSPLEMHSHPTSTTHKAEAWNLFIIICFKMPNSTRAKHSHKQQQQAGVLLKFMFDLLRTQIPYLEKLNLLFWFSLSDNAVCQWYKELRDAEIPLAHPL